MAKLKGGGADSMGYALLADEFNSIAAAYFHRAVELEGSNYAGRGEILGAIMAHEIGHLLGVTRHSDAGIMRGDWQDQELKSIAKGRLGFTEDQARVIDAAIVRRQQATVSTAGR
jgi:hypothetical protein